MRCGILVLLAALPLSAQVDQRRLEQAASEPHNWLTYNGTYYSQHHSRLEGIDRSNVANLELQWVYQGRLD